MNKAKKDYNDPLSIWKEMEAVDNKNYSYYDQLTDDQKKQFSPYLIMKWASAVEGNSEISKYYTIATNEFANLDFWNLSKHKKLQWLTICTISPRIGKQKHYWAGVSKKTTNNPLSKFIGNEFPHLKSEEIDLLLEISSPQEIEKWMQNHGEQFQNM